jgi:L-histidine N-alpha-methyltransferase
VSIPDRFDITRFAADNGYREQLAIDARKGLTSTPKTLPPKYFYDARGSQLFEAITRLPEYYQTRTETAILSKVADVIIADVRPTEIVELGSGASRKTRLLLEAMHAAGTGNRYVPFDVSEDALISAMLTLTRDYPWLHVGGVIGDFDHHLESIPTGGRRLVAFLGSTIGNLHPDQHVAFLRTVAGLLDDGDAFLLGVDLVKDVTTLEAAYNDAQGVTAEFNRNLLAVLNRELNADFRLDAFTHVARYRTDCAWIEMALRAERDMVVHLSTLDLDADFAQGEELQTEISCKFTRQTVEAACAAAGLSLHQWHTDSKGWFALALAAR